MLRPDIARGAVYLMLAAVLVFNAGCAATSPEDRRKCSLVNPKEKVYKLKIQTTIEPDNKPKPTGVKFEDKLEDKRRTCPGDTVRWDLKDHQFEISFETAPTSPFSWTKAEAVNVGNGKWSVVGLVRNVKDPEEKNIDLKYSIRVIDGHKLDPVIIVER